MKRLLQSKTVTTGLAIFSMFFGSGNLIYPLAVGMSAGAYTLYGMAGFMLTAVLLPVTGLISMVLFDGDYKAFFQRLGHLPGNALIAICMAVIGPVLIIPRIVTLSHTMMAPFLPAMSPFVFSLVFLGITFLCTFRESSVVDILGRVISPALLISLAIIVIKGFITPGELSSTAYTPFGAFASNLVVGYRTLDLLASIFFSSIVITMLKIGHNKTDQKGLHSLVLTTFNAGLIGASLLGIVYLGMSYLGAFHSTGLAGINEGELFREVAQRVLGPSGSLIIGTAVLMACLSTAIALSAVISDYLQHEILHNKISFIPALAITSIASIPLSIYGLDQVLALSAGPLINIGYPVIIALTFCNIAYKLIGFKPIKMPVLLTFVGTSAYYFYPTIAQYF